MKSNVRDFDGLNTACIWSVCIVTSFEQTRRATRSHFPFYSLFFNHTSGHVRDVCTTVLKFETSYIL